MDDKLEMLRQRRGHVILTAAMNGKFARVNRLLDAFECDFDLGCCETGMGRTAAHWTASYGEAEILKRLLDCGADLNARDHRLHTPLISAAWFGQTTALRFIIELGKAALLEDLSTALRWATYDNGYDSIPLLLAVGTPIGLPEAISLGDKNKVHRLLENGASVDWRDPRGGETLVHLAYFNDYRTIAKLLLQYGAPAITPTADPRIQHFDDWIMNSFLERPPFRFTQNLTVDLLLLVAYLIENGRRSAEAIAADTGLDQSTIEEWWQTYRFAELPPDAGVLDRYHQADDRPNSYCVLVRNNPLA